MLTRKLRRLVFVLLSASLTQSASCTSLPDVARPSAEVIRLANYTATDVIRYRELSREDFRASSPPNQIAARASEFGAYLCANIVPGPLETEFSILPDPTAGDYVAQLPTIEYHAEMDRECSWWNSEDFPLSTEYILQHEQIHFAIVEIQARRLTKTARQLKHSASSPESAVAGLERSMDLAVRRAADEVLERSTRFDEDTSFGYDPGRQSRWHSRVRAELAVGH